MLKGKDCRYSFFVGVLSLVAICPQAFTLCEPIKYNPKASISGICIPSTSIAIKYTQVFLDIHQIGSIEKYETASTVFLYA